nr:DUF305 domain-containing protein [uncultured Duganella sp.]
MKTAHFSGRRTGRVLAIAVLGLGVALGACSDIPPSAEATTTAAPSAHHEHGAMQAAKGYGAGTAFQRDMDTGMAKMMTDMHSPGYSGNVDVDFLAMMVPHHQGAVEMARLVLLHGRDPATRLLAEEIIAGQTIEIQSMQRRLISLRQPGPVVAENEFPVLGGTRGP